MNCKTARELFSEYMDGELAAKDRSAVESHLAGCSACANEHRRLLNAWELLGSLPVITPSPDFRTHFWQRVRKEEGEAAAPWYGWRWLTPALLAGFAVWALGVSSGLYLYQHRSGKAADPSTQAIKTFVSPLPPNSIEQLYLDPRNGQGRTL